MHIHECTQCGEDWECEDDCDDVDGVYPLERDCKKCKDEA